MNRFFYFSFIWTLGLFFLLIGIFNIFLACSDFLKTSVISMIHHGSSGILFFGIAFSIIGTALWAFVFSKTKSRKIILSFGPHAVSIDQNVIDQYLKNYWKELFPDREIIFTVSVQKKKIRIYADLPFSENQEIELKKKIDHDLGEIFSKLFSSSSLEIELTLNFLSEDEQKILHPLPLQT